MHLWIWHAKVESPTPENRFSILKNFIVLSIGIRRNDILICSLITFEITVCCSTESLEAEELGFRNRFHAFICPDDTAIDVAVILTQQRDDVVSLVILVGICTLNINQNKNCSSWWSKCCAACFRGIFYILCSTINRLVMTYLFQNHVQ